MRAATEMSLVLTSMPAGVGEGPDDRQKGVGRKQRRLVGQRVDDGRLLGAHVVSPGVGVGYQYRVGYEPTRAQIWGHLPHATRGYPACRIAS